MTEAVLQKQKIADFFSYSRKRYNIFLRRKIGQIAPWTEDTILQNYRFCNIFREDDKVTVWFRENIRDHLKDDPRVLLATFAFRLFNLPLSGQSMMAVSWAICGDYYSIFSTEGWAKCRQELARTIKAQEQKVTGAYMTKTPTGLDKTDGCIQVVDWFIKHCGGIAEMVPDQYPSLQAMTEFITEAPFMGPFLAYEVVTDLRHTYLLNKADDIMTWANPGPGAARGLSRMCGLDKDALKRERKADVEVMQDLMQQILYKAQQEIYWPQKWPKWEMREVEHTLCEFDKYERVLNKQGTPRSRYNGTGIIG